MSSEVKKILSLIVIFFAVPITVYFTVVGIKYFSKAVGQPATLLFSPSPITLNTNSPTIVNLILNVNSNKVGFATVQFSFDNTKVKLTSEITPTTSLQTVINQTSMATANSTGKVTLTLGLDPAHLTNAPSGSFSLAQLSLEAVNNTTSTSNLSFATSGIQIVDLTATAYSLTTTNSVVNTGGPTATPTAVPTATPTVAPTATPIATPVATPTPTSASSAPSIPTGLTATAGNGSVTLKWNANPGSDNVDFYQMYEADQYLNLNVPASQTSYTTTTDHTGAALKNGTTYSFRVSAHNSIGYGNWTNAVTAVPGPSVTPTPSPIPTPTGGQTATINFHIALQGIAKQISGGSVKNAVITIKNGSTTVYVNNNVSLISESTGSFAGSVNTVPTGTYDIYIKEPTHLQKKFTGITLVSGTNTIDWTATPLKAGDFNNTNMITITNIAQILSAYNLLSVPVTSSNAIYDVNGDGTINIIDVALILTNYTSLQVLGD